MNVTAMNLIRITTLRRFTAVVAKLSISVVRYCALLCATANIKNCPNVAPAEYSNNHTGHGKYEQHQRLPREMRIEKKQGTYILYDDCCCCCCLGCRCWVYALYSTAVVRRVQSTPPEHVQRGGLGATLWGVSTEKNAVPGGSKQQTAD